MFELKNMIFAEAHSSELKQQFVHPFYMDSFCALNHCERTQLPDGDSAILTYNQDFLAALIARTLDGIQETPQYFYDVRSTEDYSQTAPEYALLAALGLPHTQPLGIKGMNSLAFLQALELTEADLSPNEYALFCFSELHTPLNSAADLDADRQACSFLLKMSHEPSSPCGCRLSWEKNLTPDDLCALIRKSSWSQIYSECNLLGKTNSSFPFQLCSSGVLEPLRIAAEAVAHGDSFRILSILAFHGHYGYISLENQL